jgi:hypothetical protein
VVVISDTHASRTDPEARLDKKSAGQEAKLSYLGHTLVENRNGLIAAAMTTQADGRAERDAALLMLHELTRGRRGRITTELTKPMTRSCREPIVRCGGKEPHRNGMTNLALQSFSNRRIVLLIEIAGVLLKALDQRIEERLAHMEAVMTNKGATAETFDFSPVKEPRQKEPSTATEDH